MNGPKANTNSNVVMVELGQRKYDIIIGEGVIASLGSRVAGLFGQIKTCTIISDENVAPLYIEPVKQTLATNGIVVNSIIVPHGEKSKSFETLNYVLEELIKSNIERKTPIIALGGGVVGDLAGFAASIILRGVPLIQIPTTLLSQVDSSVGGKTAINSKNGKNLIGSFYQPSLVIADTSTLISLPARELHAGYAEIVKYSLINNKSFFSWLEENYNSILSGNLRIIQQAISVCCESKAAIVANDELELNQRALLNLGHTFGHAFETEAKYDNSLLHGEAVSAGMIISAKLSSAIGLCSESDFLRLKNHLHAAGLPTSISDLPFKETNASRLLGHIQKDKKATDGWPNFILLKGIGEAFIKKVEKQKNETNKKGASNCHSGYWSPNADPVRIYTSQCPCQKTSRTRGHVQS